MKRIAATLLVAGLMATPMLALPPAVRAGVSIGIGVSVGIPPPPLPVYAQPAIPGPGYIWTPGYWAWNPAYGYYWVPGTWVMPPQVGLLWTPGWWGWSNGFYRWHGGYWGMHVGFYGGVNYGFGYFGIGYVGGYWRGGHFWYNRAVNNINVTRIHNVYVNRTVINNYSRNVTRVSYNGGRGGIMARPTAAQLNYANLRRYQPTAMQTQQRDMAMRDPAQRFNANGARPAVFATQRVGHFEGPHAVRAASPMADSRMVTAPRQRERPAMATANRNRGFVEAPRDRVQPHAAERPNAGIVEAPRERVQTQAGREAFRGEPQPAERARQRQAFQRAEPVERGPVRREPVQRGARGEAQARRAPARASGEKRPRSSSKHDNGNGH